jgi:hypothetical protein
LNYKELEAKCEPNVEGYPVKIPPSTNNLPAGFHHMDININAGHSMKFLELIYEHPGETFVFAMIALAFLGMAISGVIGVIAAFRGNYNAGPIPLDKTT